MKLLGICGLAILLSAAAAPLAKADGVDSFTYQSNGTTYTWQLPNSPTPTAPDVFPGWGFTLENIPVSVNGALPVLGSFDFYSTACSGGFDLTIGSNIPADAYGPALYTGPESAPTFLPGKFSFTDYSTSASNGLPGTLAVNVPEPSSLGLLAIGLLIFAVGFTVKKTNSQLSDSRSQA